MEKDLINVENLAFLRIMDLNGKNGAVDFKKVIIVPILLSEDKTRATDIITGKVYNVDKINETQLNVLTTWRGGGASGEMPTPSDIIYPTSINRNTEEDMKNTPKFVKSIVEDKDVNFENVNILFNTWNFGEIDNEGHAIANTHRVDKMLFVFADTRKRRFTVKEKWSPKVYTKFPRHELTDFGKLNKSLYNISQKGEVTKDEIIEFSQIYEGVMNKSIGKRFLKSYTKKGNKVEIHKFTEEKENNYNESEQNIEEAPIHPSLEKSSSVRPSLEKSNEQ